MITIDHAFKVAERFFPNGAEIDMHTHDYADDKTCGDMQQVGEIKPAESDKTVNGNFRV